MLAAPNKYTCMTYEAVIILPSVISALSCYCCCYQYYCDSLVMKDKNPYCVFCSINKENYILFLSYIFYTLVGSIGKTCRQKITFGVSFSLFGYLLGRSQAELQPKLSYSLFVPERKREDCFLALVVLCGVLAVLGDPPKQQVCKEPRYNFSSKMSTSPPFSTLMSENTAPRGRSKKPATISAVYPDLSQPHYKC